MEYTCNMNKIIKYTRTACWAITALTLLLFISCKDDDNEGVSGFSVDQTAVQFVNNGGEMVLKIATNQTWAAETENDWCMVSPASGRGSGECVIKADSSYLYKERTGKIVFYAANGDIAEVQVNQFGYEPSIELTAAEVKIPSYASPEKAYVDVEAVSNVAFEVVVPDEAKAWLSIDGVSTYEPSTTIPRKQKFRFKFKTYMEFTEDRIAEVQFKQTKAVPKTRGEEGGQQAELLTKVVKIVQEKAPVIIPSREGDSLAVLAIARTLNTSTFPASRPITHWDNVVVEERTYRYNYGGIDKDSTEKRIVSVRFSMLDINESLPYQIKYMTELETFAAIGNANGFMKKIDLGPEVTELKKLKSLSLMGYGVCSLPKEMAKMESLEELDLNGNSILSLDSIKDVLLGLKGKLKYLDLGGNRVTASVLNLNTDIPRDYTLETIGMGGDLSEADWLFREMNELVQLSLSYNYFYGSIPDLGGVKDGVLPKARYLSLNLNRLTGKVPDWILYHKYLACWNPFLLVFNQEGYDNKGVMAGFTNAPTKFSEFPEEYNRICPEDEEEAAIVAKLPALTDEDLKTVPLHGNWRYYKMLNQKWYLNWK